MGALGVREQNECRLLGLKQPLVGRDRNGIRGVDLVEQPGMALSRSGSAQAASTWRQAAPPRPAARGSTAPVTVVPAVSTSAARERSPSFGSRRRWRSSTGTARKSSPSRAAALRTLRWRPPTPPPRRRHTGRAAFRAPGWPASSPAPGGHRPCRSRARTSRPRSGSSSRHRRGVGVQQILVERGCPRRVVATQTGWADPWARTRESPAGGPRLCAAGARRSSARTSPTSSGSRRADRVSRREGMPELPRSRDNARSRPADRPERRGRRRCSSSHCGDPRSHSARRSADFRVRCSAMGGFWAVFWIAVVLKILTVARSRSSGGPSRRPVAELDDEDGGGSDRDPHPQPRDTPRGLRAEVRTAARTLVAATRPGCTRTQARARRAPLTRGVGPPPRGASSRSAGAPASARSRSRPRWPRRPARRRRRPAARRGERP